MKTITNIIYPLFALFAFACLALPPLARATCQVGCLTFNNTALGGDALLDNYTGGSNTAIGFDALYSNINGYNNTAHGANALYRTPPATTTLQWAFRRVSTSPRTITIFISAIPGITVSTIRSASAPPEFRRPHSLPASAE